VIQRHGWNLLFHECLSEQLQKLHAADQRARQQGPQGFESNANVRLFAALSKLIFDAVPSDPNREEYRQGNTMGPAFRHWRRAKIGRRFRLFFRFDSKTRIIIFACNNVTLFTLKFKLARAPAFRCEARQPLPCSPEHQDQTN
jgi:toxin YhaV